MKHKQAWPVCVLLILVAGCAPATPAAPTVAPTEIPARTDALRVEVPAVQNVITRPWGLAVEDLKAQGYTLEVQSFDDATIPLSALSDGGLDVSESSHQLTWSAISQGAEVVTVIEQASNSSVIVVRQDIQTCADLDGQFVAVNTLNGGTSSMFNEYVRRNCPEAAPVALALGNTNNRRAALLGGDVNVALLQFIDVPELEREAPGEFHALTTMAAEFPGLTVTGYVVRRDLIETYRESVKDVIRAILLQRRRLQDPQAFAADLVAYFENTPEEAASLADLYLENKIWAVNGDLTHDTVQTNLEFLQQTSGLSADLKPEDVADWSLLEEVLDEIGRQ